MEIENISSNYIPPSPPEPVNSSQPPPSEQGAEEPPVNSNTQVDIIA